MKVVSQIPATQMYSLLSSAQKSAVDASVKARGVHLAAEAAEAAAKAEVQAKIHDGMEIGVPAWMLAELLGLGVATVYDWRQQVRTIRAAAALRQ